MSLTAIAVDWSGAREPKNSWLAEVRGGRLIGLSGGWGLERLHRHLVARAGRDPRLVIGLDFCFSFPAWFVRELGGSAEKAWAAAGEAWLREAEFPFWRRKKPDYGDRDDLRRTERANPPAQSVFKLVGPGHVGTGSVRGMPLLARLRAAGFAIWPFDAPRLPLVVEIYPRVLRTECRGGEFPAANQHAADAQVSALVMYRHAAEFGRLPLGDEIDRLEGRIWRPS